MILIDEEEEDDIDDNVDSGEEIAKGAGGG